MTIWQKKGKKILHSSSTSLIHKQRQHRFPLRLSLMTAAKFRQIRFSIAFQCSQPSSVHFFWVHSFIFYPSCPTSPTRMSTWLSDRWRELIISSHLISFHRVLFRTQQILQKWVIQLSCQISKSAMFKSLLQTKNKLYNLYFQKTLKRKAKC